MASSSAPEPERSAFDVHAAWLRKPLGERADRDRFVLVFAQAGSCLDLGRLAQLRLGDSGVRQTALLPEQGHVPGVLGNLRCPRRTCRGSRDRALLGLAARRLIQRIGVQLL